MPTDFTTGQLVGGCACGNLKVRMTTSKALHEYVPRQCSCSFCRSRQAIHMSDPLGQLQVSVGDGSLIDRHSFGTRTAEFLICRRCSGYVGAVCQTATGFRGVVNIKCLADPAVLSLVTVVTDWDSETTEARLARRAQTWTPAVISTTP